MKAMTRGWGGRFAGGMAGAGLAVLVATTAAAGPGVPGSINYQGSLFDPAANGGAGGPIMGVQQVEFRIYDNLSGGTLLWGRRFPVSCASNGIFNVMLDDSGTWLSGATNVLRDALLDDERFLELTVSGHGGAISPRQQLVSAPYALTAAHARSASQADADFTVYGSLQVATSNAVIGGSLFVTNAVAVGGATTLAGALVANGTARFNGAVTAACDVTVNSPGKFAGYGTIPIGGIILWSGAPNALPDGWALCDGQTYNTHVTPNLKDRFVVGVGDTYAKGDTGGANSVALIVDNLPAHSHGYQKFVARSDTWKSGGAASEGDATGYATGDTTDNAGNGTAHENRPPYYALAYIMRVK